MLKFEQKLSQKQVLSPQQILQARLLQLSTIKLEEKILNELEENDGKFRWPFDEHGNLLDNVNISRRLN